MLYYSGEKRKFPRFSINIPSKYSRPNSEICTETNTYDISSDGVGLITPEKLPANTALKICLKIPDNNEEVQLNAEVVWSRQVDTFEYRCGLRLKSAKIKPIPLVLRTIYSKL